MKTNLMLIGFCLAIPVIIGLSIWYEVSLWQECRTDHSWWYCLRILGR